MEMAEEWEGQRNMKAIIYGIIGSGKTTLSQYISKMENSRLCPCEYIEEDFDSNLFLPMFYDSVLRNKTEYNYAFHTQLQFLAGYIQTHKNLIDKKSFILDAGILTGYAFVLHQYKMGIMTKAEYDTYMVFMDCVKEYFVPPGAKNIFLDLPPTICLERVRKRGRKMEDGITLDFLNSLKSSYLEILIDKFENDPSTIIVNLTGEESVEEIYQNLLPVIVPNHLLKS